MAVYCRECGKGRGFPTSSVRSGGDAPCDFCGKVDSVEVPNPRKTRRNPGDTITKVLGNYSYPDNLLPGQDRNAEAARERAGGRP